MRVVSRIHRWGIGITCRTWSDFWLNEGMATFLADVYLGELFGTARYQHEIERSRQLWEEVFTGKDVYDALQSDLAEPIEMEDFDRSAQKKYGNPQRSVLPAYHMYLSTRDMARIGYLMLREGNWKGHQVVPQDWARRIVSLVVPVSDFNPPSWKAYAQGILWGYGYMWWVWDDQRREGPFAGAYTARGAYGQYITVLPALDVVVVHKTVPDEKATHPPDVPITQYQAILMHVVAAHCGACLR